MNMEPFNIYRAYKLLLICSSKFNWKRQIWHSLDMPTTHT